MSFFTKLWRLLALMIIPHLIWASDASHEINWWHLGSAYKDAPALGWLTITFMIFVYGCIRAIRKPLSLYLETRSKDIRHQIDEGQRAKAESEAKLAMYEAKLRSLGQEIDRLKTAFNDQALAERNERERQTKALEERILQDADDSIKANYERVKHRLADEVLKEALAIAKDTIAQKKREQIDQALKSSFVQDLKLSLKEVQQ